MRPITVSDIVGFYTSHRDLLILTTGTAFDHIDGDGSAYDYIETDDGGAYVLLERRTITDGDMFPDMLNEDGNLIPAHVQGMADIINNDGILPVLVARAERAGKQWTASEVATNDLATARARAVADVAAVAGSQSAAARLLGLDQSTVNKLVKKAGTRHGGAPVPTEIASQNHGRGFPSYDLAEEIAGATGMNLREAHDSIHAILDSLIDVDGEGVILGERPQNPSLAAHNPNDLDRNTWVTISADAADAIRASLIPQ